MPTLLFVRTALVIAALSVGGAVWYDMRNLFVRAVVALVELGATALVVRWVLSRPRLARQTARPKSPQIWAPVLAALAVRLVWVNWAQVEPISDFKEYCDLGTHLAATGVYGLAGPSAYRPAALPGILAVFSQLGWPLAWAAGVLNAVLAAATVPAVFFLAKRLSANEANPGPIANDSVTATRSASDDDTAAELAAWAWALWPSQVLGTALVATEPLFTACLIWSVVLTICALRGLSPRVWLGWAVAAGVMFGLAAHIRSHALPVPLLWALLVVLHGRAGWRNVPRLAVVCAVTLLAMLPWGIRNQQQLGRFLITSTSSGVTMAYGNHKAATGRYDGDLPFAVPGTTEIEQFDSANTMAKAWITAHPLEFLSLIPHKWIALLATETDEASYALRDPDFVPVQAGMMVLCHLAWMAAKALALGSVWRRRASPEPDALTGCAAVLWTWLTIHALFHGQFRYHAPLLPVVLVLAAVAFRRPQASPPS